MIAAVIHVESDRPESRTGATAIFPRGARGRALELYPAAFAGDGAELTGVQVIEEFQTISGPIVLAPITDVGAIYDAAITFAYERDEGLAVGSGWPPVVVGFDDRPLHAVRTHRLAATDAAALFREPKEAPRWGRVGAGRGATAFGGPGGIGYAGRAAGQGTVEAFVLLAGGLHSELLVQPPGDRPRLPENGEGSNVAVLVTDLDVGPRALGRLAAAGLEGLARVGRSARTLALAVSTGAPLGDDSGRAQRRELGRTPAPAGAESAAADAVFAAAQEILRNPRVSRSNEPNRDSPV